jgi:hypothetical protein
MTHNNWFVINEMNDCIVLQHCRCGNTICGNRVETDSHQAATNRIRDYNRRYYMSIALPKVVDSIC